jgi:hypothetical protein
MREVPKVGLKRPARLHLVLVDRGNDGFKSSLWPGDAVDMLKTNIEGLKAAILILAFCEGFRAVSQQRNG